VSGYRSMLRTDRQRFERRSKTIRLIVFEICLLDGCELVSNQLLVGAEVSELELHAEVAGAQLGHDLLQDVAVLGDDANGVALDAGIGFQLRVLDDGDYLLGVFAGDALFQLDLLANGGVGRGFDLLVFEVLERDAALDQLLRKNFDDRLEGVLVLRGELNSLGAFELDLGFRVLEAWSIAFFTS